LGRTEVKKTEALILDEVYKSEAYKTLKGTYG
jgi:hypothetical protein